MTKTLSTSLKLVKRKQTQKQMISLFDMTQVFNTDCMIAMKEFPDKFFDLAIVDPPYGIGASKMNMGSNPKRSRNDGHGSGPGISTAVRLRQSDKCFKGRGHFKNSTFNSIDWDIAPSHEYFTELFRVSRDQIIFGGNYFELPPTRGPICWDKKQPWDNFSQWEMAWTSFDMPAKMFRHSNRGGANDSKKIHPTQKPESLYRWILKTYAEPRGYRKILDTHLGSGSSRIAAHDGGYDFYGYELNESYFSEQEKRFKDHASQMVLCL